MRQLTTENIYKQIADEEDVRVCKDISDNACQVVPGNFLKIFLAQFLTKIGDALTSSRIVLPWLMNGLGIPAFFSGLLVPIRESGSLIPQLFIGGWMRAYAIRKWFFVAGCLLQATAVALMVIIALTLSGVVAGWALIGSLILFSLARGFCSVASKDVMGKTIPKTRRGRLNGTSASAAGIITMVTGAAMIAGNRLTEIPILVLLVVAAGIWVLAAIVYAQVNEYRGATDGGRNGGRMALENLSLLRDDAQFRRFVLVRSLMMSSGLAAPFVVLQAQQSEHSWLGLGLFILVSGLASVISGRFWGRFADTSSRRLMIITAVLTALACALSAVLSVWQTDGQVWFALFIFFALTVIHQGVRLARKTYIVDLVSGNRRTDYVSLSNTLIGLLLLLYGLLSALLAQASLLAVFGLFTLSAAIAAWLARTLPEVS
ncbi:MFS transporter [Reinekea blandensis]|nr:MFS transporter [Reinekea blandensis]